MMTSIAVMTGRVLGEVDGHASARVGAWLGADSLSWRENIDFVAIDPSAAFRWRCVGIYPEQRAG